MTKRSLRKLISVCAIVFVLGLMMLVSLGCFRRVVFVLPGTPIMIAEGEKVRYYTKHNGQWVLASDKKDIGGWSAIYDPIAEEK